MNEKKAGGEILGRLAGLVSRPFVGAQRSQGIQNAVAGGITRHVNQPLENALRRTGVHKAISKAYEYGTTPIPGTPKLLQPVMPYQQNTQWTCSAACLKAVLAHYGKNVSELDLVNAIGAKEGRGAECDEIAAAARKLGFLAFEYSFTSIDQAKVLLDQDIPIICDIQSFNHPGKGHYVVMVAADDLDVELMDPNSPGNWRALQRKEMDRRWWDRAMAPPHDLMPKWGIVVIPPEETNVL